MAERQQQKRRTNRVFKSLHKPLTYLGIERTLFYYQCLQRPRAGPDLQCGAPDLPARRSAQLGNRRARDCHDEVGSRAVLDTVGEFYLSMLKRARRDSNPRPSAPKTDP